MRRRLSTNFGKSERRRAHGERGRAPPWRDGSLSSRRSSLRWPLLKEAGDVVGVRARARRRLRPTRSRGHRANVVGSECSPQSTIVRVRIAASLGRRLRGWVESSRTMESTQRCGANRSSRTSASSYTASGRRVERHRARRGRRRRRRSRGGGRRRRRAVVARRSLSGAPLCRERCEDGRPRGSSQRADAHNRCERSPALEHDNSDLAPVALDAPPPRRALTAACTNKRSSRCHRALTQRARGGDQTLSEDWRRVCSIRFFLRPTSRDCSIFASVNTSCRCDSTMASAAPGAPRRVQRRVVAPAGRPRR